MSKKVKNLITGELAKAFENLDAVAVISPSGIDGVRNNQLRRRLRQQGLRMTVVKNTLARRATAPTKLAPFAKLLDGPSAVIHGPASMPAVARLLLEEKQSNEKLELRGLLFDGDLYEGEEGVTQVSKLPTRQEAIANLLGLIVGPRRKLAGAIKGPGGRLGAVLKTIEEQKGKEPPAAAAAPGASI
jgi:large subunit ribosomal protein L10